jgi:hypothetical protein
MLKALEVLVASWTRTPRVRTERGQGTLEYVGMIIVAAILVVAVLEVAGVDVGGAFQSAIESVIGP